MGQLCSTAVKCCLWLGFKVELIAVQGLVGQGQRQASHTQQAHTGEVYMLGQPAELFYIR